MISELPGLCDQILPLGSKKCLVTKNWCRGQIVMEQLANIKNAQWISDCYLVFNLLPYA